MSEHEPSNTELSNAHSIQGDHDADAQVAANLKQKPESQQRPQAKSTETRVMSDFSKLFDVYTSQQNALIGKTEEKVQLELKLRDKDIEGLKQEMQKVSGTHKAQYKKFDNSVNQIGERLKKLEEKTGIKPNEEPEAAPRSYVDEELKKISDRLDALEAKANGESEDDGRSNHEQYERLKTKYKELSGKCKSMEERIAQLEHQMKELMMVAPEQPKKKKKDHSQVKEPEYYSDQEQVEPEPEPADERSDHEAVEPEVNSKDFELFYKLLDGIRARIEENRNEDAELLTPVCEYLEKADRKSDSKKAKAVSKILYNLNIQRKEDVKRICSAPTGWKKAKVAKLDTLDAMLSLFQYQEKWFFWLDKQTKCTDITPEQWGMIFNIMEGKFFCMKLLPHKSSLGYVILNVIYEEYDPEIKIIESDADLENVINELDGFRAIDAIVSTTNQDVINQLFELPLERLAIYWQKQGEKCSASLKYPGMLQCCFTRSFVIDNIQECSELASITYTQISDENFMQRVQELPENVDVYEYDDKQ